MFENASLAENVCPLISGDFFNEASKVTNTSWLVEINCFIFNLI